MPKKMKLGGQIGLGFGLVLMLSATQGSAPHAADR